VQADCLPGCLSPPWAETFCWYLVSMACLIFWKSAWATRSCLRPSCERSVRGRIRRRTGSAGPVYTLHIHYVAIFTSLDKQTFLFHGIRASAQELLADW